MGLEGKQVSGYRIGPQLGSGGMGTVHRAETLADGPVGPAGTTVAVKFFHQHLVEDERAFRRFEQEAEIGKNIRHSNVVRTYELGKDDVDGETWHFIVMEFIEGQTLRDLVEDLGTLPEHLILQIADQTLDALSAIHAQDIVHRDIKPENLVITSEHRVLLMDLGIARQTDRTTQLTQSGEFLGSIPYAAPEQIFEQDKVGPRSDLYAFGVALYEMATGERPFPETDLSALLALKMEGNFRRPRLANPDIERFLDEVIVTCLEKEPAARFSSCAELRTILQEGEQSVWWRERTSGREAPVAERALKRLRVARDTPMVGRGRQLDRLHELYKEVLGGAGCTLFVSGPAGSGKSRLVYSFLEEVAASQGPVILGGRNIGSGGRAYQPFVEAVHDLLGVDDFDAGERLEKVQELLRGMLPDTPGVIAPLAEFLLGGLQPGMESGFSKDALVAGFAGLLHPISEARPVVIVIEDLHLAGPETLEMFGYLARTVGTHRVFLIGLYRDDEVQDGSPLHRLMGELASREEVRALTLEPLPRSATDELVRSLVIHERTVRRLGRLIHEKSDGNPLIILEMIGHLRAIGKLAERDDGLTLQASVDELELPSTVRDIIGHKLSHLDDEERETLEAAAVLGFDFRASLLASVLEEKRIKLLKRLAVLERKHKLLRSSGKDSFRFATQRVYETIYEAINSSLRSEYHSVVADVLEEEYADELPGDGAYALVRHLLLGERAEESLPYIRKALDHVAASYHASSVAPFLDRLAEALPEGDPETMFALFMRQWFSYDALGRREDQLAVLERARACAEALGDPGRRAQVHVLSGSTRWKTGDYEVAAAEAELGITLAREAGDRQWEANALHAVGSVWHRKGDYTKAAEYVRQALDIRRKIGDRHGEARSLHNLAAIMIELAEPWERALATQREALEIYRELGDRRFECRMLSNLGGTLMDSNRFDEAIEHLSQAVDIGRELGDFAAEGYPLLNLGGCYAALGRVKDAKACFSRALASFAEAGMPHGELAVHEKLGSVLIGFGDYDAAHRHLEAALDLAERTQTAVKQHFIENQLARLLHRTNRRKEAWKRFDRALGLAERLESTRCRGETLHSMGAAALEEGDHDKAVGLLERAHEALGSDKEGSRALLLFCRLARAHYLAGRPEEAAKWAERAEEILKDESELAPDEGPEIYFTLKTVYEKDDRGLRYLDLARSCVATRTQTIRDPAFKEHYLTRVWPTREIVEEAKRLLDK